MDRVIMEKDMKAFETYLIEEEKSKATVEKYMRDVRKFASFAGERLIDKMLMIAYKTSLEEKYAVASSNSMIAALNAFLRFMGWQEMCIKQFRVQRAIYCPEEKELTKAEYIRLVETARRKGNGRLCLILQTICGTGIRVSELEYITVEAVQRGEAVVSCKGKNRIIFIVRELQKKLAKYIKQEGISKGPVFVGRTGKPVNRCCIWRDMKTLCRQANVSAAKVFPHNLRHLFARAFYEIEKDIAKLADVLGHSSIDTTRIYIVTTGREHRRHMEKLCLII